MLNKQMLRKLVMQLVLHQGIGPTLVARIVAASSQDEYAQLPFMNLQYIRERYGVSERQAQLIGAALKTTQELVAHDDWCEKNKVRVITRFDEEYPFLLQQIGAPPAALWIRGALAPSGMRACALVGSREATHYGKRSVAVLVPALVRAGVATVSGGARGIDCWVHEETIAAGGHTTVVMGCGFMHTYPPEHKPLFERIVAAGGCLVSPFPPAVFPTKATFPARNRVIAGLSSVCVVVQAAKRSGALITAAQALEENREVAAVPGPIDEKLSVGPNELIARGARVVHSIESLLELCGASVDGAPVGGTPIGERHQQVTLLAKEMSPAEAVLALLDRPLLFDELLEVYTGVQSELQALLFELQVAGKCKQNHAGMWVRCG